MLGRKIIIAIVIATIFFSKRSYCDKKLHDGHMKAKICVKICDYHIKDNESIYSNEDALLGCCVATAVLAVFL